MYWAMFHYKLRKLHSFQNKSPNDFSCCGQPGCIACCTIFGTLYGMEIIITFAAQDLSKHVLEELNL